MVHSCRLIGIGPLKPRHSARRARPRGASFAKCTGCTYTQGYWKNHATWPVTALRLGDVLYSQSELVNILETAVSGNGLVQLAHQLIAQANDTCVPQAVLNAIAQADALIGSKVIPIDSVPTADTSAATKILRQLQQGGGGGAALRRAVYRDDHVGCVGQAVSFRLPRISISRAAGTP